VRRLRITALPAEQLPADTLPDVARAMQQAIAVLREQGALVDEVRVPIDFEEVMVRNGRIIAAEAWALHREYIEDPKLPIDPWVRKRTIGGKAISAADYIDELSRRRRAAAAFADWMQGRDILLTPTLPITATAVDEVDEVSTPLATFTRVANYLGICGLSLPAGMSADGLPVAVQLLGAPFTEAALVRAGRAFQQATEWHELRPDLTAWENVAHEARV
jgi:aspartyl-tRNA(Asn)/glutamyl-tRNA(Gln) amidotransferase subunit A